jgi:hypothetical protein
VKLILTYCISLSQSFSLGLSCPYQAAFDRAQLQCVFGQEAARKSGFAFENDDEKQ